MKHAIRMTFLAALLAAAALPAAAQDTVSAPEEPARRNSLSLSAGFGSAIGLWRDLSPRVRAGVEVGGSVGRSETEGTDAKNHSLLIRPSVMLFSGEGAIRPYTTFGLFVQRHSQEIDHDISDGDFRNEVTELGANAGVGLEWRPASRVTIGGHAGISGSHSQGELGSGEGHPAESDGWSVGTFSSGVMVNLFF